MTRKNKVPRAKAANKLDLPSQAERMFLARLDAVLAKSSDAVGLVMRMNAKVRQSLNDVEAVEGAVEAKVARLEAKAVVAKTSVVCPSSGHLAQMGA